MEADVTEIIPGLWLGNYKSAYSKEFLSKYKIKYVLTIMENFEHKYRYNNIMYYCIPFSDKDFCSKNLIKIFENTSNFINKSNNILIHCKRGHHRSASVVAAYLLKYCNISYDAAILYINKKRPYALTKNKCITIGLFNYYLYLRRMNMMKLT